MYENSQASVPVVTGELKASGSLRKINNGYEIKYSAPYASLIDGMGEDFTMIFRRGDKPFRFPKSHQTASCFISNSVKNTAEDGMRSLIYGANGGPASAQYNFYIQ